MIFVFQNDILAAAILVLILLSGRSVRVYLPLSKPFRRIVIHLLVLLALDLVTWTLNEKMFPGAYIITLLLSYAYYAEQAIVGYAWGIYSYRLHSITLTNKGRWLHRIPIIAALILLAGNPLTGDVFVISADNVYSRGWGVGGIIYAVCIFYYMLEAIVLSAYTLLHSETQERRDSISLLIASMLPILGAVLQLFFIGLTTIWSFPVLGLLILYLNVQSSHAEQAERELEKSRTAVTLSQIQPHFLYNSLVGIKELCDTGKQQTTSKALEHFAYYLRGNLDSLSYHRLIAFGKEISHVRDYLYLEKMRFEDKLHIVWELYDTDFLLPPLTLQPIVENAVRHGITEKEGGGTLTIRSERTARNIIITVIDDGVGFDPDKPKDDGRTHVGIESVRTRLRAQCGGVLTIESKRGKGTTVKIVLPGKEPASYEDNGG